MSESSETRRYWREYARGAWDAWRGNGPPLGDESSAYGYGFNFGMQAAGELAMSAAEFREAVGSCPR